MNSSQEKQQDLVRTGAAEFQGGDIVAVPCGQVLEGQYISQGMKSFVFYCLYCMSAHR